MYKKKTQNLPSNKQFGYFFTFIFFICGTYFYFKSNQFFFLIFLSISIIFFFITFFKSKLLEPLNYYWMKFGIIMGKIINPFILAIIFFFIFSPMSIIFRVFGRKEFIKFKKEDNSFWEEKDKNQTIDFRERF